MTHLMRPAHLSLRFGLEPECKERTGVISPNAHEVDCEDCRRTVLFARTSNAQRYPKLDQITRDAAFYRNMAEATAS